MINYTVYSPPLPATPFSFSILVNSPILRNLPFCPVSALLFPLATTEIYLASMIIVGLDLLTSFLLKRSLAHPPDLTRKPPDLYPNTLTMPQLTQLMEAARAGQFPIPAPSQPVPGQGFGPVGPDQPLFPDNLSISLFVSAPFAPFDGSPDTSFNVPLFEIPGVPGNLIIALGLILAQFLIERSEIPRPNGSSSNQGTQFMLEPEGWNYA